ncbi:hypothetical protein KS4_32150 [Poriferisphaera corsica]|uniref:Uncharacterized protein n=1 Tax=Poriferisphaera corsica TaxID=2528020 RepID=A0A517YY53_9BACT|nr:PEP-CTERM sorting domain-containing protein [Poriferisphaera corsica]QDU35135.1 hypothetical protein KS4_32150 [Poriferisphaera corsica]
MNFAKTTLFGAALAMGLSATAGAAITATYGWEDGGTILGNYGDIIAENTADAARSGTAGLKLTDDAATGTPQAYAAFITGLAEGDTIEVTVYAKDLPGIDGNGGRIWGHYGGDANDINVYDGSASGLGSYSDADWTELTYSWTMAAEKENFILEFRTYNNPGDGAFFDDLSITVSNDNAIINIPTVIPEPASLALLGLSGLMMLRRRK